jgi:hypothetical protein
MERSRSRKVQRKRARKERGTEERRRINRSWSTGKGILGRRYAYR